MRDNANEFNDLENALRQMPLRAPSSQLDARVDATLNHRPAIRWVIGLAAGTLAAAAALLLVLRATGTQSDAPNLNTVPTQLAAVPAPAITQVVETDEEWSEDGIVAIESEGPIRQVRVITTHQITEVENGKLATMTFPQEDVYQYVSQAF